MGLSLETWERNWTDESLQKQVCKEPRHVKDHTFGIQFKYRVHPFQLNIRPVILYPIWKSVLEWHWGGTKGKTSVEQRIKMLTFHEGCIRKRSYIGRDTYTCLDWAVPRHHGCFHYFCDKSTGASFPSESIQTYYFLTRLQGEHKKIGSGNKTKWMIAIATCMCLYSVPVDGMGWMIVTRLLVDNLASHSLLDDLYPFRLIHKNVNMSQEWYMLAVIPGQLLSRHLQ